MDKMRTERGFRCFLHVATADGDDLPDTWILLMAVNDRVQATEYMPDIYTTATLCMHADDTLCSWPEKLHEQNPITR